MTATIQLGVIHRNRLFRECLVSALSLQTEFLVNDFEMTNGIVPQTVLDAEVDVWLVDLALPNGIAVEVTRNLNERCPDTKVIALVSATVDETVVHCVAAGAQGCVLEDASIDELQDGIRRVINGDAYCSSGIVNCMFRQMAKMANTTQVRMRVATADLTSREIEILELIANHQTNKQIAKRLSVSLHTVKNHVHHILEKLQVRNRSQAADYTRHNNWLTRAES